MRKWGCCWWRGSEDSSLHLIENGEIVWRTESGGHRSLLADKWWIRISLGSFQFSSLLSEIGIISNSPNRISPWKNTLFNPNSLIYTKFERITEVKKIDFFFVFSVSSSSSLSVNVRSVLKWWWLLGIYNEHWGSLTWIYPNALLSHVRKCFLYTTPIYLSNFLIVI